MLTDQVGDAVREHPGLAGARPGHHQQRPVDVDHRVELVGVQAVERRRGAHLSAILRVGCYVAPGDVEPGEDGRRQGDLGATWVMHAFGASATVAEVLAVVEHGCPS